MKKAHKKGVSKKSGLIPLSDRVLIKETKALEGSETKSGIIIPATVSDDKGAKKGSVIAVGEGRYEDGKRIPMYVSVGDTVLFSWGDKVTVEGVEYYVVSESNIIAVIK